MQDRFKFRVWCENNQEWEKDTILISNKNMYEIRNDKFTKYTDIDPKNHIINFCTGLKDKNGKLIYEGDILRVIGNRDTSGYGVVEYLQAGCQFFVNGYLNNPSPYHPRKKGEFYQQLQEWLCTEVIGNIYENPELLERQHD